jgi:hypothetical protein
MTPRIFWWDSLPLGPPYFYFLFAKAEQRDAEGVTAISHGQAKRRESRSATRGNVVGNRDFDPNGVVEEVTEPFQGSPVDPNRKPRVAAAPQPWAMLRNRFAVS